jgi:hypothetical protein
VSDWLLLVLTASLGSILGDAFGSPLGIALQIVLLAGLVLLVSFDWAGLLRRRSVSRGATGES